MAGKLNFDPYITTFQSTPGGRRIEVSALTLGSYIGDRGQVLSNLICTFSFLFKQTACTIINFMHNNKLHA